MPDVENRVIATYGPIPISQGLMEDMVRLDFREEMTDYIWLGRSRRHQNPIPEMVLFPRMKRVTDAWTRFLGHVADAREAFKYGIPEYDE